MTNIICCAIVYVSILGRVKCVFVCNGTHQSLLSPGCSGKRPPQETSTIFIVPGGNQVVISVGVGRLVYVIIVMCWNWG